MWQCSRDETVSAAPPAHLAGIDGAVWDQGWLVQPAEPDDAASLGWFWEQSAAAAAAAAAAAVGGLQPASMSFALQ
ncbi:MAG: hypothetical protein ACK4ZJ_16160 [Allorhizobium sp.]